MKHFLWTSLLFAFQIEMISCTKSGANSIVGKWNIVKDSSYVSGAPPFFNAGTGGAYMGVAGDYYDFKQNGTLYIKEGSYADTVIFSVSFNNQLTLTSNSYNYVADSLGNIIGRTHPTKSYSISSISATHVELTSILKSNILTPIGYLANKVDLKK